MISVSPLGVVPLLNSHTHGIQLGECTWGGSGLVAWCLGWVRSIRAPICAVPGTPPQVPDTTRKLSPSSKTEIFFRIVDC